ncbi:MAG: ABC transporter ATP-binding protein [bacterium]
MFIQIKNIYKSFENMEVLKNLSLDIEKGEALVIVGESGCGKSVLLKHIIRILKPDQGTILINEENIANLSEKKLNEIRKKISMVFQGSALFDSFTVEKNVGFFLYEHSNLSHQEIKKKVAEKLEMVGLKGTENKMPSELSGGMRKRIGLARAIIANPEIILYDEPTSGLDPIKANVINDLIKKLHITLKITSIIVTHDISSALKIGTKIAMLHQGKILCVNTPQDFIKSNNPILRRFIEGRQED